MIIARQLTGQKVDVFIINVSESRAHNPFMITS